MDEVPPTTCHHGGHAGHYLDAMVGAGKWQPYLIEPGNPQGRISLAGVVLLRTHDSVQLRCPDLGVLARWTVLSRDDDGAAIIVCAETTEGPVLINGDDYKEETP